jgi:hypothetical protein
MSRSSCPRPVAALALVGAAFLASGCSIGPRYIETSRTRYNQAVQVTAAEEMLLNVVRTRYADPPEFLALSGITSQFDAEAGAGLGTEFGLGDARVSGNLRVADRPTVTYSPLQDENFTRRFLTPVGVESIALFARNGRELDRVLRLAVQSVNGVENAPHRGGPGADPGPFLWVAAALGDLARQRQVGFAYQEKDEEVSDALDPAAIRPQDVVSAAEKGFRFRRSGPGPVVLIRKTREVVLRLAPEAAGSPAMVEVGRALNLRPGRPVYPLVAGGQLAAAADPAGREEIVVTTRSVEQVLHFVGEGVEVPPDHRGTGCAPAGGAPGGAADLLRVRVSKCRPPHPAVAVRYRGHWYYIDDADRESKETFELLLELYNLEIRGGGAANIPVLTLSAGR